MQYRQMAFARIRGESLRMPNRCACCLDLPATEYEAIGGDRTHYQERIWTLSHIPLCDRCHKHHDEFMNAYWRPMGLVCLFLALLDILFVTFFVVLAPGSLTRILSGSDFITHLVTLAPGGFKNVLDLLEQPLHVFFLCWAVNFIPALCMAKAYAKKRPYQELSTTCTCRVNPIEMRQPNVDGYLVLFKNDEFAEIVANINGFSIEYKEELHDNSASLAETLRLLAVLTAASVFSLIVAIVAIVVFVP